MAETSPANKPATGLDFAARPQRELDVMPAELSSRRTGLSFQRTRTSADRTLMSIMRTSLSLPLGPREFMRELRAERALLVAERYVHGKESFPYSITLLIATLLLLLGLVAIIDMAFRSGPLS